MELQGQTAIVTGAGRNIGRAIALELAGMSADVVVAEVDRATGERTAEEVRKRGRRAMAWPRWRARWGSRPRWSTASPRPR